MRILRSASQDEISTIKDTLDKATKRDRSGDLLCGFPWDSTLWYFASLEDGDFENPFLLWDDSAWNVKSHDDMPPRKLEKGLQDFFVLKEENSKQWTKHLIHILEIKDACVLSVDQQPFLILIGESQDNPLMILDGNHRAVALLWHAHKGGSRIGIPTCAWVGLSAEMPNYPQYKRIWNVGL